MENFWGFSAWYGLNLIAVLLASLLLANALKKAVPFLRASLIPTSVLGGTILLVIAAFYKLFTGDVMFNTAFFGGNGIAILEVITYHALALGFITSAFKSSNAKLTKKRSIEIFNTGVTTVSTYLLQAVLGFSITLVAAYLVSGFFNAAGILLPFGFGQGTGQALNYGNIFEQDFGFEGGKNFGLTIAALGFISASIGGVVHLNILKKKGRIIVASSEDEPAIKSEEIQAEDEIPMQGSMDKFSVQLAIVAVTYFIAYAFMCLLGVILPGMKSVIFGFNFLLGVIAATLVKLFIRRMENKKVFKKRYINSFLMTRISNFCFDIMVVAGIAAIRLGIFQKYWSVILILAVVGLFSTYFYNRFVARSLFPDYPEEQFLAMYGMLTGTASTGIILLREIDGDFKTPASDNLVFQNIPAIVFGFPIMLLATLAPVKPILTLVVLFLFFVILNIILFRSKIFKRRKKQ